MTIRQLRMNANAARSVSFYCEYGAADVKACLRQYVQLELMGLPPSVNFMGFTYEEADIISIFRAILFEHLQPKYADKFGKWAFRLALKDNLIIESAVKPGKYYLSATLATKTGRPKKEEVS